MHLLDLLVACLLIGRVATEDEDWTKPYLEITEDPRLELRPTDDDQVFNIALDENVEIGFVLGKLLYNGDTVLQIEQDSNLFDIKDNNVVTKADIDYETVTMSTFTIAAKQFVLNFNIQVRNLNDNEILLSGKSCNYEENKKGPTGCKYTVQDEDGISEKIKFSYGEEDRFEMSPPTHGAKTCEVELQFLKEVDFEKETSIALTWHAEDEMGEEFASDLLIVINIVDVPDEPPRWKELVGTLTIEEEKDESYKVEASDGDIFHPSPIAYKVSKVTPEGVKDHFSIAPDGTVTIKKIDRDADNIDKIEVEITATETEEEYKSITGTTVILINDINDKRPEIKVTEPAFELDENFNSILPTKIIIDDKDINENGKYKVTLTSSIGVEDALQVIPNEGYKLISFSILVSNGAALDYDADEKFRKPFEVTISADDGVQPPTTSTLTITLRNVNDNAPVFLQDAYEVRIPETFGRKKVEALPVENPKVFYADDADYGDTVSYRLVGAASILELVEKEPAPGVALVVRTLAQQHEAIQLFDYEEQQEVVVSVEARDNFPGSKIVNRATAQLTIHLVDVNDEAPKITTRNGSREFFIMENVVDISAEEIVLKATDADSKPDLHVFIDWESSFAMQNRETVSKEKFAPFVGCLVVGDAPSSSEKTSEQELSVMLAVDAKKSPDFETFDTLYVDVVVEDRNTDVEYLETKKKTIINLVFSIGNENDNAPKFVQETLEGVAIKEHSEEGTLVAIVKAKDADGVDVTYEIRGENDEETTLVTINVNGEIKVGANKALEADPDIFFKKFNLYALDDKQKHKTPATLKLSLIDTNDHSPEIEEIPSLAVDENVDDYKWDVIKVKDGDRDEKYRDFKCALSGEGASDTFQIATERFVGCRVSLKTIDAQHVPNREAKDKYALKMTVTDNPDGPPDEQRTSTSEFTINILDVNDNKPVVDRVDLVKVTENTKEGTIIGTIIGVDEDLGENGEIEYLLDGVEAADEDGGHERAQLTPEHFILDVESGEITLKKTLKGFYGDYKLMIKLTDKGKPPMSSVTPVKLTVEKYNFKKVSFNDFSPNQYLSKNQELLKPLKLFSGDTMKSITATDNQGEKYDISIEIKSETANKEKSNYFRLKQETTRSVALQLENFPSDYDASYDLVLTATAIGAQENKDPAELKFSVRFIDVDSDPTFAELEMTLSGVEEEYVGDLEKLPTAGYAAIDDIQALPVFYKLHDAKPSDAFALNDVKTPVVAVTRGLDLEVCPEPYFVVRASRSQDFPGEPNDSNLLRVRLDLVDINNHAPVFTEPEVREVLIIDQTDNTVATVHAVDADSGDVPTYSIVWKEYATSGEHLPVYDESDPPFTVTETGGVLSKRFKVTDAMSGSIRFQLAAHDGQPEHDVFLEVNLQVIAGQQLVGVQFDNTKEELDAKRDQLEVIFSAHFELDARVKKIESLLKSAAEGAVREEAAASAEVTFYFLDDNVSVSKDKIISRLSDRPFRSKLQRALATDAIMLYGVKSETRDISYEETYKIALIAVSAAAGALIILLVAFFTYKLRSQNNRLHRLEHAEARRPTAMLPSNIPGANRRATEFINPNFKSPQNDDVISNDISFASSTRSSIRRNDDDDEDFIGVENNDIFKTANGTTN